MNIIVACEYSARVRDAFIAKGHNAWSCDLLPTQGDPSKHFQGSIELFFDNYGYDWDMMIAHPPCTYLTCSAEWAYADIPMINGKPRNMKPETLFGQERRNARNVALAFIEWLWKLPIEKICIENA